MKGLKMRVITSVFVLLASFFFIDGAKPPKQCSLPPFVGDLPNAEKKEILAIWKDYKMGEDCADQRQETQEIIDNLPSDIRAVVFGRSPSFLKDASASVKKMFRDIIHNRTLSHDEKNEKLSKLAEQILSRKQLAEFKRYSEERDHRRKEFEEAVNNLSPEAKEIYQKLERLKAERTGILEQMSDEVRKELRQLFRKSKGKKKKP